MSGASPIVDVQTTQQREVLTRAVLDALPTGRNYQTIGATLPSVSMGRFDVGGSTAMQQSTVISAGSTGDDMAMLVDGMNISSSLNSGSVPATYHNDGAYQEYVYQVSGANAEFSSGGVTINMIPKEGSNTIKSDGVALFTNGHFQAQNVDDAQRAQGVLGTGKARQDLGLQRQRRFPDQEGSSLVVLVGPVLGLQQLRAERHRQGRQSGRRRQRRPRLDEPRHRADRARRTRSRRCTTTCRSSAGIATSNSARWRRKRRSCSGRRVVQHAGEVDLDGHAASCWSRPATPRTTTTTRCTTARKSRRPIDKPPYGDISHLDIVTGRRTVAATQDFRDTFPFYNVYGASSYITGSHAFRFGVQWGSGWINSWRDANGDMVQRYSQRRARTRSRATTSRSRAPNRISIYLVGVFLQDSWTLKRLTVNPGIRFEAIRGSVPAQTAPAGRFVPDAQLRRHRGPAELEELRASRRRGVRPVRQRQDGDQGQHRQVHAAGGDRLRRQVQPAAGGQRHRHLERPEPRRHRPGQRAGRREQRDARRPPKHQPGSGPEAGRTRSSTTSASSTS